MSTAKQPLSAIERRRLQILREATTNASSRLTVRGHAKDRAPPPVTVTRISCLEKDQTA